MNVLVYGATGSQQFPIIEAAQKKGAQVFAVTSNESNFSKLVQAGATPVQADLSDATRVLEISKGMDAIAFMIPFSLPNPADGFKYAKHVIDAAKASGVKIIVWNTSGFMPAQATGDPATDVKLEVKEYLAHSGIPYVIIEPSVYAENLLSPYAQRYLATDHKISYPTPERMQLGWIATQDVAALIAEALHKPELSGQSFRVSGLENLTGGQLAHQISLGLEEDIRFNPMSPQEFGDFLEPFVGEEAAKGITAFYQGMAESNPFPIMFSSDMPNVLAKLPVKMTSMREWANQHKQAFQL